MGRITLGLLLYAALVACNTAPPPSLNGDTGTGSDSGMGGDDAGTGADAATGDTGVGGDAGNAPDTGVTIIDVCDPVDQTGCNNDPDTKCVIEGGNPGTECVPPSPNDKTFGDSCTGQDCEAGLVCLRDATTATTAHCRRACNRTTNVGCEPLGTEYECRTMVTQSNWGACTMLPPLCDPYTQAPCVAAEACQPFLRRTGTWEFRCRIAGAAGIGDPCGPGTACGRGLACIIDNATQATACREYCMNDGDCTAPASCTGTVPDPAFMFCSP